MAKIKGEPFTTPVGTISYPHVWVARQFKKAGVAPAADAPFKYSCDIIFHASDPQVQVIRNAYAAVFNQAYPSGVLTHGHNSGDLIEGRLLKPEDPFYADKVVLKTSQYEEYGVTVLDENNIEIVDKSQIYAGAQGQIHGLFYSYDGGSGGIACTLLALKKTGEGEPLGDVIRVDPNTAFGATPQSPVGQPPVGQPPAGNPVGQPPAGNPVGQPPAGNPVGQPPVGQPPVGQPPVGQPPVGQPPVGQPPVGQQPVGQPPVGQQPPPPAQQVAPVDPTCPAGFVYNAEVGGDSNYQAYITGGWTHEQLVEKGIIVPA